MRRAFEGNNQRLRFDFLEQQLHAAVFEFKQVLEQEHFVDHFLRQNLVLFADMLDHAFFLRAAHHVDDFGGRPDTAKSAALDTYARQHIAQHLGQLFERRRLHPTEGGHAKNDVVTRTLGELLQHLRGLVTVHVNQQRGDDLRVFVTNHFDHFGGIQAVQPFDTVSRFIGLKNSFQQVCGTVIAQRLVQHGTQIAAGVQVECRVLLGLQAELLQNRVDLVALDLRHGGHGRAQ